MDEFDKRLYRELNSDIEIPSQFRTTIIESLNEDKIKRKKKYYSLPKIVITACASLMLTMGIVYAGTEITKHIWKEPEKVVGINSENVKVEADDNIMSKDEAIEKLNQILKKFGHEGENIKHIELSHNPNNYELSWHIELDIKDDDINNNLVGFDARGGNSFRVRFEDVLNEKVHDYRTNKKEAEETARKLCEKYGYDTQKYNNIRVTSNITDKEDESYLWYVDFYREYDGIINPYERISIGFIPEINEIYYFDVTELKYDDNPVEITKEMAEQIVKNEEQKIKLNYETKNIDVNLGIEKMNGDAYKRINDYEQYYKEGHTKNYPSEKIENYRTESIVRKVWKVTIEYDMPAYKDFNDDNIETYNFFDRYYTYYVDATTGEIIGGSLINQSLNS